MANIGFFDIPADDVNRAKQFYTALLGWSVEPAADFPDPAQERQIVITGAPEEGTVNTGGIYKRHGVNQIMPFVLVSDLAAVLARVEQMGGTLVMPLTGIREVGLFAVMKDTEGNLLGLLQRSA